MHWWVSFSFSTSAVVIDGGDQITSILTFLLIPICLIDKRKSHWAITSLPARDFSLKDNSRNLFAMSSYYIIRLQVAIIYFHSAIGKLQVEEWLNGTALYYWFIHPVYGMPKWMEPLLMPLLSNTYIVPFMTWAVILFEILLFMGLVIDKKWRPSLLKLGLLFHFAIILIHGLFSFFFAISAALIFYLSPIERSYNIFWKKHQKQF